MKERLGSTLTAPETMVEGGSGIEPEPDFSGAEVFHRDTDPDEIYGRTTAEMVGDKLFYGTVGAAALTLAAGVVAGKRIAARR